MRDRWYGPGVVRRLPGLVAGLLCVVELTVLAIGFALGGTLGAGTILFALATGPVVELGLRIFDRQRVIRRRRALGMEPVPAEGAA